MKIGQEMMVCETIFKPPQKKRFGCFSDDFGMGSINQLAVYPLG